LGKNCNIRDPVTGESYSRDARFVAQKAETYLTGTGIGDTSYFGPELEHFVFNGVRYDQGTNYGFYEINAQEANWDAGEGNGPNLGHKLRPKEGYFPVPPADTLQDTRTEMVLLLEKLGIPVEAHHHEVATGGQGEIDMRFAPLTRMADNVMAYKYVVKGVARKRGMTATFMPKPLFGDNGHARSMKFVCARILTSSFSITTSRTAGPASRRSNRYVGAGRGRYRDLR
jgi:glutamine synthetase